MAAMDSITSQMLLDMKQTAEMVLTQRQQVRFLLFNLICTPLAVL